ncbi:MAG: hypothetical protein F9K44_15565 [Hyphomicrobiaceae bacterium]|nr:MAG: hypothetical protein F9K44_15565 [Hyphomicrobiaceae bacterium]
MTNEEFSKTFPSESELVEWKSGISNRPLQDAVVAFSNTGGGLVLIGVDDDGNVLGRELTPGTEDILHRLISDVRNPGRYWIQSLAVDDRPVVVLSIERRVEGFAQTSNGRILARRGAQNTPLFDTELSRFIAGRSLERFESRDTGIRLEGASEELLSRISQSLGWTNASELPDRLSEHGLARNDRSRTTLTVAGALYLLEEPHKTLGKAMIEVVRFPEESADFDKRTEITGPIDEQVTAATEEVRRELGSEVVVLGVHRHELPRLPPRVLREAIANAVAHRSYEMNGSAIRIEIRPQAVRIVSPGRLPAPVTVDNIREAQAARNLAVISVLRRLRLAEDAGLGIDVIQDKMLEELLDAPEFVETGHSVEVTLPVGGSITPSERAWVKEIEARGEIEPRDRVLLVHAARGAELTNSTVRKIAHVDRLAAMRALQRLRDAGFLVQRGERGGASYALDGSLEPPAGLRLPEDELKDLVVGMASKGPIKNADVRARTGLDRVATLRLLDQLVAEDRLVRRGQRRGAHYLLPDRD